MRVGEMNEGGRNEWEREKEWEKNEREMNGII